MKVFENYNLINNNTFGINAKADRFIEYYNDNDILNFIHRDSYILNSNFLILGEGSNILFSQDFKGSIIHPATKDIKLVSENENYIYIEASAGVSFCDFIEWSINNGAYGIENLSYIPGTVGASAVQNVGAYGTEAGDFILEVKFLNVNTGEVEVIGKQDCEFDYRNSIFKNRLKNKAIILSVTYCLNKTLDANLSYADVKNYFEHMDKKEITANMIRAAIKDIRNRKLPDIKLLGSAGSFFKNPVVEKEKLDELMTKFPDIRYFDFQNNKIKLAAGWLIDSCGLKGFEYNGAAVYDKQALILINNGNATGKSVMELADIVREKVLEKFDINLEPEVLII